MRPVLLIRIILIAGLFMTTPLVAEQKKTVQRSIPTISIIIDDMGNHRGWGEHALAIPGKMTYAFLPHTPYAEELATKAHKLGKEVMLHLPMQTYGHNKLGPGALTLHLTEKSFKERIREDFSAVPYAVGMNNHMGSLLTQHPGAMAWVMDGLAEAGAKFFIDSRTTRRSVAQLLAQEHGIPNAGRDIFLDNERNTAAITKQFLKLVRKAYKRGYAIGIGHPYPETSRVLKRVMAHLDKLGVRLVPASEMITLQGRNNPWPEHSFPSQRVAKNLKRSLSLTCCEEPALR